MSDRTIGAAERPSARFAFVDRPGRRTNDHDPQPVETDDRVDLDDRGHPVIRQLVQR